MPDPSGGWRLDANLRSWERLCWVVDERDAGKFLRDVLRTRLGVSRGLLRQAAASGGIYRNGEPAYGTERAACGDVIELRWEEFPSPDVIPEPVPFETVYEDGDVLVVNKPPGMLVHPTRGQYRGTLANGVIYAWRSRGLNRPFRPLHRLDRDTSGLVLIAKNRFAHQRLSGDLRADGDARQREAPRSEEWEENRGGRLVRREYLAIVEGRLPADRGILDLPVGRDPQHPGRRRIDPAGKPARTRFEVEAWAPEATLVRVVLETGRTHQIRVHLAAIGHPLVGDALYGRPSEWIGRQALHAVRLHFRHPRSGEAVEVEAPWFSDMAELWERLSGGGSGRCAPSWT